MSEKKKYVEVVGSRVLIQKIRDSFRGSMLLVKSGDVISRTPADFDSILELYGGPFGCETGADAWNPICGVVWSSPPYPSG